jgi:hypothetical protein
LGRTLRNFGIDKTGRRLYGGNQQSYTIVQFDIDLETVPQAGDVEWAVGAHAVHVERRGALHAAAFAARLIAADPLCCLRRCSILHESIRIELGRRGRGAGAGVGMDLLQWEMPKTKARSPPHSYCSARMLPPRQARIRARHSRHTAPAAR